MTRVARAAVVLASAGRPHLLSRTLRDIAAQTLQHRLVISVPDEASLPADGVPEGAIVVNARGLAAQRNAGIEAISDADYIFFFDDDAVIRADYLERGVDFFERHPDVVGLTGRVLLDGAVGDEIAIDAADQAIAASAACAPSRRWAPTAELYGCNFAYRPRAAGGEQFDARLPLYSWLEDHDFARRLMRHGALAKVEDCVIVHLGADARLTLGSATRR
jgi:GT2 family glycosyltransferase